MKFWNEPTIEYMAKQINDIDNEVNLDLLLKAVNLKMCAFAPNQDTCIGCHYNPVCRDIHSFLDARQAQEEDYINEEELNNGALDN